MVETRLLTLVARYPHPVALGRHIDDGVGFAVLQRVQRRGLVVLRGGLYRLTRRGRDELWMAGALARLVAIAHAS